MGKIRNKFREGKQRYAPTDVSLCLERYLRESKKKNNSKGYIRRQKKILEVMLEEGPVSTREWAEADLKVWYCWRAQPDLELSRSTFIREVKIVKAFWNWAVESKIIDKSPADTLVTPRALPPQEIVKKQISVEEIQRSSLFLSTRVYAAVTVMWGCGLRSTEIERLTPIDIPSKIEKGKVVMLRVTGHKQRKARHVPVPNEIVLMALDYLTSRKKKITSREIFSSMRHLSVEFTPLQLRNSAILRWISHEPNIHKVAAWAGHPSVATTAKFIDKPKDLRPDEATLH